MIEVNKQGEVWIFAEQHGGKLEETALELLSKGRELADTLKVPLAMMLLGDRISELCVRLGQYGADKVYLAEHPLLEHYQTSSYAKVIDELIHKHNRRLCCTGRRRAAATWHRVWPAQSRRG